MTLSFLDNMLGGLIQPPKQKRILSSVEKEEKSAYRKLYRICKKHGISYKRDMSYWDFSDPVGTIGCEAEGIDNSYEGIYYFLKETFLIDTLQIEKGNRK